MLEISARDDRLDGRTIAVAVEALVKHLHLPSRGDAVRIAPLRRLVPKMKPGMLYRGARIGFMVPGAIEAVFANRPLKWPKRIARPESWTKELETAHMFSVPGGARVGIVMAARVPVKHRMLDLADDRAVDAILEAAADPEVNRHWGGRGRRVAEVREVLAKYTDKRKGEYEVLVYPEYGENMVYNLCDNIVLLSVSRRVMLGGSPTAPEDKRVRELFIRKTANMPRNPQSLPPIMTFSCDGRGRLRWLAEGKLKQYMASRRPKSAI